MTDDREAHAIRAIRLGWPEPTSDEPDFDEVSSAYYDDANETTDGCTVPEPDGYCEHGHPTWMLRLGLI